jgi:hypothetical protein
MTRSKGTVRLELSSHEAEALFLLLKRQGGNPSPEESSLYRKLEAYFFETLSIEEMEELEARTVFRGGASVRSSGELNGHTR